MAKTFEIQRRKGNPFKVGDVVRCLYAGWDDLVEGEIYTILATDEKHVTYKYDINGNLSGGAIFERFEPIEYSMEQGADEYENIMQAQELMGGG